MLLAILISLVFSFNSGSADFPETDDYEYVWNQNDVMNKIVGGQETTIEEHPYQVSFIVNNTYFCGGFIISENYILTAAHCAQNVDPETVVLRAGSTWRKNGTIIPITEVTPHPDYDNPAFDKDVAVMKTVEPIEFNDVMQPIALPPKGRSMEAGTDILVSGWGRTKQGASTIPERLMDVVLPVVSFTRCRIVYPTILTHNMFCSGNFFFGGKGTCQRPYGSRLKNLGYSISSVDVVREYVVHVNNLVCILGGDSGGAAIQEGMAVGIVSFGRGCAQPLSPSVFADIAAPTIRDFIDEHTGL